MTAPRTKRQFAGAASHPSQRQITSFFTKTSSSACSTNAVRGDLERAALDGPALPAQVQTDLLTVGMRVRKAIPEGYKTGSVYSAFALWSEEGKASITDSRPAPTAPISTYSSAMRELEPFCGINKVGGLAFQPAYRSANASEDEDSDAMPGLTSSQDTVISNASSSAIPPQTATAGTRKRFFTSEEDEAAHDALSTSLPYRGPIRFGSDSQGSWLEEEISPCSLAPPAGLWENARVLALPRRLRQGRNKVATASAPASAEEWAAVVGQENIMVVVRGLQDGNDFEEASFLDYAGLRSDATGMDIE